MPVAFFFEGAPGGWEGAGGDRTTNSFLGFLGTRDGQALIMSFAKIQDVTLRRSIVDLVEAIGRPRRERAAESPAVQAETEVTEVVTAMPQPRMYW